MVYVMPKVQGDVMPKVQDDVIEYLVIASNAICSIIGRPIAVPCTVGTINFTAVWQWFSYRPLLAVFDQLPALCTVAVSTWHMDDICQSLNYLTY